MLSRSKGFMNRRETRMRCSLPVLVLIVAVLMRPANAAGVGPINDSWAVFSTIQEGEPVTVYTSLVDNRSGDPIFLPATAPAVLTEPLQAGFGWQPDTITAGQEVAFEDRSTGQPDGWSWDFGDGEFTAHPTGAPLIDPLELTVGEGSGARSGRLDIFEVEGTGVSRTWSSQVYLGYPFGVQVCDIDDDGTGGLLFSCGGVHAESADGPGFTAAGLATNLEQYHRFVCTDLDLDGSVELVTGCRCDLQVRCR